MANMTAIVGAHKQAKADYNGETVNFTYRPYTLRMEREALAKTNGEWANSSIKEILLGSLTGWDVEDGGQPMPISEDVLELFPLEFLVAIFQAMNAAMQPGKR